MTVTDDSARDALVERLQHADEHHASDNVPDDFIREHLATNACDAASVTS